VAGEERLSGVHFGIVGVGGFFKQQVRHRASECVWWGFGLDDGFEVAVGGAEAAKKVEHLARFRDRVTNIAELIG
jgi:hypothetical protein